MSAERTRRDVLTGLSAVAAELAIGPAAFAQTAADWQADAPDEWKRTLAAARAEGTITVAGFPALQEKMSAAFQRDTGIQLNFLVGNTAEQSARLEAEARAKNLTIDILLGGGRELGAMMHGGFLAKVAPQIILPMNAPNYFRGGHYKWMDDSQQYLLQGAEYVYGWLIVNKNLVKPEELTNWNSLLDPKYRGKIASYDVRSPGPGQGAAAWINAVLGIDYIKKLFIGQEVKFTVDSRALVEGVARGTAPIAFGAVQSDVERFRAAGITDLAVVLPADYPGYLTGGFSVLKEPVGAPHPNAATVFINWFISNPGQTVYQSVMLDTSRRVDVHTGLPDYLIPRPAVDYYQDYSEKQYFSRDVVVKLITDALGNR
jgi:ABC-type Fe3+ transport system substrate-binding protein